MSFCNIQNARLEEFASSARAAGTSGKRSRDAEKCSLVLSSSLDKQLFNE